MAVNLTTKPAIQAYVRGVFNGTIKYNENDFLELLYLASDAYYNTDASNPIESPLTDQEFDEFVVMLKQQNPNHPFFAQVGSEVRGPKIDLPHFLGSLDQLQVGGDVARWILTNKWLNHLFCITDKVDGTSALIIYGRGGLLQIAYSRGNGRQGADITRHIRRMLCLPKKMPRPCAIRAEVVLDELAFQEFAAQAVSKGEREPKNSRNFTAGQMNASESLQWFCERASVIATSVIEPDLSKQQQLSFMKEGGFEIPAFIMKKGSELNDKFLTNYIIERKKAVPYEIDGIVIDVDDLATRIASRRVRESLNPTESRKFKTGGDDNIAVATVVAVHWEPSKDGYVKPRVEIEPTELVGVTITYATGHNAKFIRENYIGPGAKVRITRAGAVIPQIIAVVEPMPIENM